MKMKLQLLVLILTVGLSFQSCLDILNQPQMNGATRDVGCVPETCQGGQWVPHKDTILVKCKTCNAWGDPHFDDFSGARFDWMGQGDYAGCNYALVQKGSSMNPEFGVFMDFKRISHVAYVGAPTTYQDDINTKVVLYPMKNPSILYNVEVNGVKQEITQSTPTLLHGPGSTPTSVYAWRHSSTDPHTGKLVTSCVRLYGKTKILVELCDSIIHIWAPPKGDLFPVTLGGLCGSTDSRALREKKLVARDGTKYRNPGDWLKPANQTFGNSWKAKEQTKGTCQTNGKRKRSIEIEQGNLHMACANDANNLNGVHHRMCAGVHKGRGSTGSDDHLNACKYDLCVVANDTEHQKLEFTVDMMLALHTEIHARTRVHNEIILENLGFDPSVISQASLPHLPVSIGSIGPAIHTENVGLPQSVGSPISHHHLPSSIGPNGPAILNLSGGESIGLSGLIGSTNSQQTSSPLSPEQQFKRITTPDHRGSCPNRNPCIGGFTNPRCTSDLDCNLGYKCCRGCPLGLTCMPADQNIETTSLLQTIGSANSQQQRPRLRQKTTATPRPRTRPHPTVRASDSPYRAQDHRGTCPNSNPCFGGFSNPRCAADLNCNPGYKCCRGCSVGLTCMPTV